MCAVAAIELLTRMAAVAVSSLAVADATVLVAVGVAGEVAVLGDGL
jgi:hypothetical protein